MGDWVLLDEASRLSGLHVDSIERLLRQGVIRGYKDTANRRRRWLVSRRSLMHYTDPVVVFEDVRMGPKMFLVKRRDPEDEGGDSAD